MFLSSTHTILTVALSRCLAHLVLPGAAVSVHVGQKRDISIVLPVLYPQADTVWTEGGTYNVTWDTSMAQTANITAFILLRKAVLLAYGFDPLLGRTEVELPKVIVNVTGYSIDLCEGNLSPQFTIIGVDEPPY